MNRLVRQQGVQCAAVNDLGIQRGEGTAQPACPFGRRDQPVGAPLWVIEGRVNRVSPVDPLRLLGNTGGVGGSRISGVALAPAYLAFCHCHP